MIEMKNDKFARDLVYAIAGLGMVAGAALVYIAVITAIHTLGW